MVSDSNFVSHNLTQAWEYDQDNSLDLNDQFNNPP